MSKRLLLCAAVVGLSLTMTATSSASLRHIYAGDTISLSNAPYRGFNGGEFVLNKLPGQPNYTHTFCAETGETFQFGRAMLVKSVGTVSVSQGTILTAGAAKLFRDYTEGISGNGNGYGFTPAANFSLPTSGGSMTFRLINGNAARIADGRSLQLALWRMIGAITATNSDYVNDAFASDLVAYYSSTYTGNNYFGVRFANLVWIDSNNVEHDQQDQFIIIPEPGSLLIWAGTIGLAGFFTRRRRIA